MRSTSFRPVSILASGAPGKWFFYRLVRCATDFAIPRAPRLMSNSDNAESIFGHLLALTIADTFTPLEWENYVPFDPAPSAAATGR